MRRITLIGALAAASLAMAGCGGGSQENQAPVARLTATPLAGQTPLLVTLDASGSTDKEGKLASYAWTTGDGATLAGISASHTYARPGEFTVTLTVTDHKGLTSTATQLVKVENRPPVAAFTATPPSGMAILTVAFDASASSDPDGTIMRYEWQFPGGATASGATVEHRFEEAGHFDVTLRVVDDLGASSTVSSRITVEELPTYRMTSLGTVGDLSSEGYSVNENGDVAGQLVKTCSLPCQDVLRTFLYRDGQMIDIGTLGGAMTRFGDFNSLGHITGASQTTEGQYQAFLYADRKITALPPFAEPIPDVPFGDFWRPPSEGVAINDRDEIVGNVTHLFKGVAGIFRECREGFRWVETGPELVAPCSWGVRYIYHSDARFINEAGTIVVAAGTSAVGGGASSSAILIKGDVQVLLRPTESSHSKAVGLNDRDTVLATYWDIFVPSDMGNFLYRNGQFTELPKSGDWFSTFAPLALNDQDSVAGDARANDGNSHAFLYTDGSVIDLGTLGGLESHAVDLNDVGEVTGWARTASGDAHAFVYSDGKMIDLGTLGGCCSNARAINNLGQVTGGSSDAQGAGRAFLATPIRLLLTRFATAVKTANVDAMLTQQVEIAQSSYAERNGPASCAALVEFRARVQSLGAPALGQARAAEWKRKAEEISTAVRCR